MLFLRLIWESFRFAWSALRTNLLRTTLSLLGVTVGIFSIIASLAAVDSLKVSIKDSFSFLGTDVMNVEKWPYEFGPNYPWWKYFRRPQPTFNEYEFLQENLTEANYNGLAIYSRTGPVFPKAGSNSSTADFFTGISFTYKDIFDIEIEEGRYFTQREIDASRNVTLIGADIASELYPNQSALGKVIKLKGLKLTIIGIMKKEGSGVFGLPSNDKAVLVPFDSFGKVVRNDGFGASTVIALKGSSNDPGLIELEYELRGLMRAIRSLKPKEDDSFALNRTEAISNQLDVMFSSVNLIAGVIGGFAMFIGLFGIANIMFVSVKERTRLIGIQKSLGAKDFFILFQFLFEAIFLSIIGGLAGLLLVMLIVSAVNNGVEMGNFKFFLGPNNAVLGIGLSTLVGFLAGIIPAAVASRLDPVIAIRSS